MRETNLEDTNSEIAKQEKRPHVPKNIDDQRVQPDLFGDRIQVSDDAKSFAREVSWPEVTERTTRVETA